jgi:hypothetical protein
MAQTLKFGKGTWATKTGSSMAYNDQNGNYKPLPFNVERDSIATRVNKEGLIEVVGHDKLRIDYTDSAKGVALLEPSRTNLVTYSEDFSQSYWTKSGSSILSNNAISPDGSLNASKLVENSNNSQHICFNQQSASSKTFSFFAKSDGNQYVAISYDGGTNFNFFDIENGILGNLADANRTSKIEDYGNGWYRCSMYNGHSTYGATIWMSKDGINTTYQGDGTSGVYIWGAMLEENSIASSYIPTSGSTVQRQADVVNGSGNSEVFNDSEGVLFFNLNTLDTSSVPVFSLSDGTFSNEIEFAYYGTNQWNVISRVGGANTSVVGTVNGDAYSKFLVSYTSSNFKVFLNGFLIGSNTMASAFSGLKKINFSYPDEANPFYGKTKEIGYYDTALTDEELEYLTSYRSLNELVTELNLNTL